MTKHLLTSGLLAGIVVALLATLLQFVFLERNILLAERYESGELGPVASGAGHDHTPAADHDHATDPAANADHDHDHADEPVAEAGHDHAAHSHAPDDAPFWQRQTKTLLTMIITYCGYGLAITAAIAIARHFGKTVDAPQAMLMGLAGFAAFSMAPAMGLEPNLPGVEAADLAARQAWWLFCAASTVVGLAVLAYGHGPMRLAGVVALALPHIIGAPHLADFVGTLPSELAAQHAARSLGVGLAVWVTLGWTSWWFLGRTA